MIYHISSGVISTGITLYDSMFIYSGGVANNNTVNGGGYLAVSQGGVANSTTVNSTGSLCIFSGGVANSTTVNSGGYLNVYSGGTATNVIWTPCIGSIYVADGAYVTYASNYSGVYFGDGLQLLSHVAVMENKIVSGYSYKMYVMSSGVANSTTVKSGGGLRVYSGGTATNIIASTGAKLRITVAPNTYIQGTYGGSAFEMKDAQISGYTVNRSGGYLYISSGGVANNTTVNGSMHISSGGVANSTTVNGGGSLFISSSGVANNTTVNGSGYLCVSSGGTATNVIWTPCIGSIYVADGAYVTYASNYSGVYFGDGLQLLSHVAVMENKIVSGYSYKMYVMSSGVANSTTVNRGGYLYIYSGGVANSTTVNGGGSMRISSDGVANSTTVNRDGSLNIYSDGVANNTTVNSGGEVCVYEYGKLSGEITIADGGYIGIYEDATIQFDLTERKTSDRALINDYSLLNVSDIYGYYVTIIVGEDQLEGVYKLADNFTGWGDDLEVEITVGYDEYNNEYIELNETVIFDDVAYTLSDEGGNLTLTISGNAPAPANKNRFFAGAFDGSATDMLVSVNDGKVSIYANNVQWAELPLDDGWNVVGVADFNGDGKDDILRQHNNGLVIADLSNGDTTFTPQVLNSVASGWAIEGTGDFNGDGVGDILIANPTAASETVGLLGYWKGGTEWTLINGYSPEWEMVATGDFNNDGKTDMLWRNEFVGDGGLTYNAYCTWIVDNANDWRMVSVANPDEWNYLCSGDFNADGCNDIAMINGEGVVGIWGVADGYLNNWSILSAVDTAAWEFVGVGDFNGDNTDDIAWCNSETGLTGYWQIKDKTLESWQNIATVA